MKNQHQIKQTAYKPDDGFIGREQKLIRETVIPYQYSVLKDEAPDTEKSHVIANFINAGKALRGEDVGDGFYGMVFQDSDAAKWLETVAYSLAIHPDSQLEATADEVIDIIASAQDEDGYLDTAFTIKDKNHRWQNLLEGHELYCAGHMMEAACAYYEATGKDKLLKVMEKNAKHIYDVFITGGHKGYPGHPEVELALMKMYRLTGNHKCLELAKHFIDVRGVDPHYFEKERKSRDWVVWGGDGRDHDYMQCGKPVREQSDAIGHSVRAVYLYTAMADLASETNDKELLEACDRLWESIIGKRMYLTGGIGSSCNGEAFTVDYDLPNDTAYCETCASIGLMFFASRMLESDANSKYGDVMERAFYNTVLAGIQLDGKSFFYVNPLECVPGISGKASTHRHDLTTRPKWYACACCPPNLARCVCSFGKHAYGENEKTAFCHMFASGEVDFENGLKLSCKTEYPFGFDVNYTILDGESELAIRIPEWSKEFSLTVNGGKAGCEIRNGYAYLDVKKGDEIVLKLDSLPYYVYPSNKIPELTGSVALCRGPLVYCFEGKDNDWCDGNILSLSLTGSDDISLEKADGLPDEIVALRVPAVKSCEADGLYTMNKPAYEEGYAKAIPYYAWCNRGENQMRVWMNLI
ncbi:MAG: glycoside hydrolase family 127 protein [Oscillospiraceae bacterium]|nr:glycoside hydrolase family 127 protein [Oscillospiraceae bacterium]